MDFIPLRPRALFSKKLIGLSDSQRSAWFNLILIAGTFGDDGMLPHREALRESMWPHDRPIDELLDNLVDKGLIDENGPELRIHNWHKHQFRSPEASKASHPDTIPMPVQVFEKPALPPEWVALIQLSEERWFNNGGREVEALLRRFENVELVRSACDAWYGKPNGKASFNITYVAKVCVNLQAEFAKRAEESEAKPDEQHYPVIRASEEKHELYRKRNASAFIAVN